MRGYVALLSLPALMLAALIISADQSPAAASSAELADVGHCPAERFVVAIDIGHTPQQPGADSARGVPEYEFNERLAREIRAALHAAGLDRAFIVADRADGQLTLTGRTRIAAAAGAQIFLSVHHDSVQPQYLSDWEVDGQVRRYSDRFSGYSLFVSERNPRFADSVAFGRRLAAALRERGLAPTLHHAEPIAGENRPLLDSELGLYRYDGLAVLRTARMPAVLLEAGIIVNRDEELRLDDAVHRADIVAAVVAAVHATCAALEDASDPVGMR